MQDYTAFLLYAYSSVLRTTALLRSRLLVLAFLLPTLLFSAPNGSFPTPESNPTWKVGVWYFWTGNCESKNWKYGNTVSMCGQNYIEVLECDYNNLNCSIKGYLRTQGEKVYVKKTNLCTEPERLMYNFGSDNAYTMAYNADTTDAKILYTSTLEYYGIQRQTQTIEYHIDPPVNSSTDRMNVIEGIGSDIHPFFPFICFGDFCESNWQTMEYRENDTIRYSKNPRFPLPCKMWLDTLTGVDDEQSSKDILSPNPASHIITIAETSPIQRIDVYNSIGVLVQSITVNDAIEITTLDISALSSGLYLVKISTAGKATTRTCSFIKE